MRKTQKVAYMSIGFLLGMSLSITTPAIAANLTKTLQVTYRDIKLVVDGNSVTPKDGNGNIVEPFVVDGTTYLPVRAVGEALGKSVNWDGNTNTVYIGETNDWDSLTVGQLTNINNCGGSVKTDFTRDSTILNFGSGSFQNGVVMDTDFVFPFEAFHLSNLNDYSSLKLSIFGESGIKVTIKDATSGEVYREISAKAKQVITDEFSIAGATAVSINVEYDSEGRYIFGDIYFK